MAQIIYSWSNKSSTSYNFFQILVIAQIILVRLLTNRRLLNASVSLKRKTCMNIMNNMMSATCQCCKQYLTLTKKLNDRPSTSIRKRSGLVKVPPTLFFFYFETFCSKLNSWRRYYLYIYHKHILCDNRDVEYCLKLFVST